MAEEIGKIGSSTNKLLIKRKILDWSNILNSIQKENSFVKLIHKIFKI